jgi:hypothetical protein
MHTTPPPPDDQHPGAGHARRREARIDRTSPRPAAPGPRWCVEMLESPLMDLGIGYTVGDGSPVGPGADGDGWIEFDLPTDRYQNPSRHKRVRIRLSVIDGRLAITAPDVYAAGSLRKTSDPPPGPMGDLRLVRLGDEGDTNLDLIMAADGTTTAVLLMETIQQPFNRADIVHLAREFALGIDYLDFVVEQCELVVRQPGGSP